MIRALHERSGELSRFVPDLNSNATADHASQVMSAVASRPDGEPPSRSADAFVAVLEEICR